MQSPDFIDQFLQLTDRTRTPEIFRLWSAIAMLGGALERRVWIKNGDGTVYANNFILLVAPPGVGKFVIEEVRQLWSEACQPGTKIPAFHVAPDNMTNAGLIDTIAESSTTFLPPGEPPFKYHSLLVAAEEFSVLVPKYDMEYIGTLNSIWNNKGNHEERRRHGMNKHTKIINPQLNMLAGAQPSYLSSLFPEEAWTTGLGRRLMMIYSSETPKISLFAKSDRPKELRQEILDRLAKFYSLFGPVKWEESAMHEIDSWYMSGEEPVPQHSKLVSYNKSRGVFALKLSLIASLSRSNEMVIRKMDVDRGLGWLLEAERVMPDIFRAMVGRSDKDVIAEMHMYVTAKYAQTAGKPPLERKVKGEDIRRFLLERVPHEKVASIIDAAEKANIIARMGGTQDDYMPRPKWTSGGGD